jgi:hypothetical protein
MPYLRGDEADEDALRNAIGEAIYGKPESHFFNSNAVVPGQREKRLMSQIGG